MSSEEPEAIEFLAAMRKFITEYFGGRCRERESGCPICEMWALYDLCDTMII
jgi:hypothetical protein